MPSAIHTSCFHVAVKMEKHKLTVYNSLIMGACSNLLDLHEILVLAGAALNVCAAEIVNTLLLLHLFHIFSRAKVIDGGLGMIVGY